MSLFQMKKKSGHPEPVKRQLSYQAANLQGIGTREEQEDSFAFSNVLDVTEIRKKGMLAAVADGMGGMINGRQASEAAIATLKDEFEHMNRDGNLAEQLRDSAFLAGDKVKSLLGGKGGSTLIACVIYEEQLYFVSVGDSFLYLKRGEWLYRMNSAHNCLNQAYLDTIRSGSMHQTRGCDRNEEAALTQFVGMDGMNQVDYLRRPFFLRDGDILLICSDGIGGTLTEQELLLCLEEENPVRMCEAIEKEICRAGREYQDNYTALIIQCGY